MDIIPDQILAIYKNNARYLTFVYVRNMEKKNFSNQIPMAIECLIIKF